MRTLIMSLFLGLVLLSCSNNTQSTKEIPEICRFADLNHDAEMAKICNVRSTRYGGLSHVPPMRFLVSPKGGTLVLVSDRVELRLPDVQSIPLDSNLKNRIDFSERAKRDFIHNNYDYFEIYPSNEERVRLFRLKIPVIGDSTDSFCFKIPNRVLDSRVKSVGGQALEKIACDQLSAIVIKDSLSHLSNTTLSSSSSGAIISTASSSSTILSPAQKLRNKTIGK